MQSDEYSQGSAAQVSAALADLDLPVEIQTTIGSYLPLTPAHAKVLKESLGRKGDRITSISIQQYVKDHFGLRATLAARTSPACDEARVLNETELGFERRFTERHGRMEGSLIPTEKEAKLMKPQDLWRTYYPNAESLQSWRDTEPGNLSYIKLLFRYILLGSPPAGKPSPDAPSQATTQVDSVARLTSFFESYWPEETSTCELGNRYELLVLLLARHFTPPPRHYERSFRDTSSSEEWLKVTGLLFELLSKEIHSVEDRAVWNEREGLLRKHLGWFSPRILPGEGWLAAQCKQSCCSGGALMLDFALRCMLVNPLEVVKLVWEKYYGNDRSRICEAQKYEFLRHAPTLAPLNQKGALAGILSFLFEKFYQLNPDNSRQIVGAAKAALNGVLSRKKQISDGKELVLFRFPYKEKAFADAVEEILSICRNYPQYAEREDPIKDQIPQWFFASLDLQSAKEKFQGNQLFFMGGDSALLLAFAKYSTIMSIQAPGDDSFEKGFSLLHQLMVYRSPETIQKLIGPGSLEVNAAHEIHYNCPPLTFVMRTAIENDSYLHHRTIDINQLAQSVRIMVGRGANPLAIDESADVKRYQVHAVMYAALDERLMPLLKELLRPLKRNESEKEKDLEKTQEVREAEERDLEQEAREWIGSTGPQTSKSGSDPWKCKLKREELRALIQRGSEGEKKPKQRIPNFPQLYDLEEFDYDLVAKLPESYPQMPSDVDIEGEMGRLYAIKPELDFAEDLDLAESSEDAFDPMTGFVSLVTDPDQEVSERVEFFTGKIPNGDEQRLLSTLPFGSIGGDEETAASDGGWDYIPTKTDSQNSNSDRELRDIWTLLPSFGMRGPSGQRGGSSQGSTSPTSPASPTSPNSEGSGGLSSTASTIRRVPVTTTSISGGSDGSGGSGGSGGSSSTPTTVRHISVRVQWDNFHEELALALPWNFYEEEEEEEEEEVRG